jgi:hypothetical protein
MPFRRVVTLYEKELLLTWHNIVPENGNIIITVSTALFMPEATSMQQLMLHNALVQAPWPQ